MLHGFRGFDAFGQPRPVYGPCERESQLEHYGQVAATSGASVADQLFAKNVNAAESIVMGVFTGLTVWALTGFLEKKVLKKGRR